MIKILFFTDTHYTGKSPVNRKDNLLLTSIEKTKEIIQIAKEEVVDVIIHGGDMFDTPDVADSIAGEIGALYMQFPQKVYVVAGNHDLRGNNYNTLPQTKLGLLDKLNIVHVIKPKERIEITKGKDKVIITAQSSDYKSIDDLKILNDEDAILIHVVHAMITDTQPFPNCITINELLDTKAHITLSGDYHIGWGIKNINGKYFINPGALVRKTIALSDMNRHPQVVIITINNSIINAVLHPLVTAKSYQEVFDLEKVELERKYQEKLMEFKNSLDNTDFLHFSTNFKELIKNFAMTKHLEEEVIQEVYKKIDEAEQRLQEN